jgi:hypothetical protein
MQKKPLWKRWQAWVIGFVLLSVVMAPFSEDEAAERQEAAYEEALAAEESSDSLINSDPDETGGAAGSAKPSQTDKQESLVVSSDDDVVSKTQKPNTENEKVGAASLVKPAEKTATPSPTATNTPVPKATNTSAPKATNTPVPKATNTPAPTATNTPAPTATNTPAPTATNTPVPAATNTPAPTATNTPVPAATNTPLPAATNTPTPVPEPVEETQGEKQSITVISMQQKVNRNEEVTLTIQGAPNTNYFLQVVYKSVSTADGLGNKTSDSSGMVSWSWKIGGRTSIGPFHATVEGGGDKIKLEFEVVE